MMKSTIKRSFALILGVIFLDTLPAPFRTAEAGESGWWVITADNNEDGLYDATHCFLREAINISNTTPFMQIIAFDIPGAGAHVIELCDPLPAVTGAVIIDILILPDPPILWENGFQHRSKIIPSIKEPLSMESQTPHQSPDMEELAEKPKEEQLDDTMDADLFNSLLAEATPRLIITPLLLAINVLVFVLMLVSGVSPVDPGPEQLLDWGASYGPYIFNGEWWRLATAMFVHIGAIHIIFNMQALWNLGRLVERLYGNWTYLLMYLLGGIGGSIASLWWHSDIISAGASGAIFGLAGGLAIGVYRGKLPMPQKMMQTLLTSTILFIGYNLTYGFMNEGIDNAAHIGGLVVGAISGWFLLRELPRTDIEPRPHYVRGLVLCAVMLILVFGTMIVKSEDPLTEIIKAEDLLFAGETDQAMEIIENVLAREPDNALGHFLQGNVFLEIHQYEEALSAYSEAISLDPQLKDVYYNRGIAYIQIYRLEDALDDFTHSIDSNPSDPYGFYWRGLIYTDLNQPELAISDLEKAISLGLDDESHSYAEMVLDEIK